MARPGARHSDPITGYWRRARGVRSCAREGFTVATRRFRNPNGSHVSNLSLRFTAHPQSCACVSDGWLFQSRELEYSGFGRAGQLSAFRGNVDPRDPRLEKPRFGALHPTKLELILRTRGIDTVIISSISANVCCDTLQRR